jgi:hypothetical protein
MRQSRVFGVSLPPVSGEVSTTLEVGSALPPAADVRCPGMTEIERSRCPHCVGPLSAIDLDGTDFVERGPAIVCERCDRGPAEEDPLVVPSDW